MKPNANSAMWLIVSTVLLTSSSRSPSATLARASDASVCLLAGRVVRQDRVAANGATVKTATSKGAPLLKKSIDAAGLFSIAIPLEGVVLSVEQPGYATYRRFVKSCAVTLDIALDPAAMLRGRVTGPNGEPTAATMSIVSRLPRNTVRIGAMTGAGGTFEVDGLLPAKTVIIARAEGFAPVTQTLDLQPGQRADLSIRLHAAATIRARIVTEDGRTRKMAQLQFAYAEELLEPALRALRMTSVTDPDGRQSLAGIAAGVPISIQAVDGAKRGERINLRLVAGETRELILAVK